jgi:hypothetical protein
MLKNLLLITLTRITKDKYMSFKEFLKEKMIIEGARFNFEDGEIVFKKPGETVNIFQLIRFPEEYIDMENSNDVIVNKFLSTVKQWAAGFGGVQWNKVVLYNKEPIPQKK